jgi:hypothetical protein
MNEKQIRFGQNKTVGTLEKTLIIQDAGSISVWCPHFNGAQYKQGYLPKYQ